MEKRALVAAVMSSLSPSKRRRTATSPAMTPEQGEAEKLISFGIRLTLEGVDAPPWPAGVLPVEIFDLILNYLPRSSVQNMRLVNKEFESKVSHYLFRVVVLPFRPEIYGISLEPEGTMAQKAPIDSILRGSVKLQHKGMKVFKGFGKRINKFAMSFEFGEQQLSFPPVKSDQESITSFWGVYRWPFKKYNRYTQLEGLEQAADETGTMTEALRCIVNAKELGISIDGGLGWLAGPDVNHEANKYHVKLPVFGESLFAPEPKHADFDGFDLCVLTDELLANMDVTSPAIKAALQQAGYHSDALDDSVQTLLQGDGMWERLIRGEILDRITGLNWTTLARAAAQQRQVRAAALTGEEPFDPSAVASASDGSNSNSNSDDSPPVTPVAPEDGESGNKTEKEEYFPLKPNNLTSAQREMLLEVEWAQRAFMQSYAIAIIDNKATFQNIEALTIARLPSRHLPILRRSDFWDSLSGLKSLSLAIIPDWRDVIKLPTSWVQDDEVQPSQAVTAVYNVLREHVLHRENIKTLNFEWIGGGEEATGLFSRNQHILPAPIVPKAMQMVHRDLMPELLSFPYIEHLSLKNCWITPHIMTRLCTSLKSFAMDSLTLKSVSLTAPLATNAHPNPLPDSRSHASNAQLMVNTAAVHNQFLNLQMGAAAAANFQAQFPQPAVPVPNQEQMPLWLEAPRLGSWAQYIDLLTPGNTLASMRRARGYEEEPPDRGGRNSLRKLKFESCGYVRLPLDFNQAVLDPPDIFSVSRTLTKRVDSLERVMMCSDDTAQAAIVNHINVLEKQTLEEGFNLTVNWDSSRSELFAEALLDGITHPGRGRFSGTIDTSPLQTT